MLLNNYTQATTSVTAVGATTVEIPLAPSVTPSVTDYLTLTFYDADGNIEIVQCTGISGSTLTVVRGAEGTTAREWPMGSTIASRATAAVLKSLGNTTGVLTSVVGTKADGISGGTFTATDAKPIPGGLGYAYDGTHIFVSKGTATILAYDVSGAAVPTSDIVMASHSDYRGICSIGGGELLVAREVAAEVYRTDSTGAILQTLSIPELDAYPKAGLAYHAASDTLYVWTTFGELAMYTYSTMAYKGSTILEAGAIGMTLLDEEIWLQHGLPVSRVKSYDLEGVATGVEINPNKNTAKGLVNIDGVLWGDSDLGDFTQIVPIMATRVTGTNVGSLLAVGDTVGSTTVASVDSANQVTLTAQESAGSITLTKTPTNNDLVTSINGATVWR